MIASAWLTLLALATIAAGTPRQAAAIWRGRLHERGCQRLRLLGMALLAISLVTVARGADWPRQLLAWIGVVEVEALAVALGCTTFGNRTGYRVPATGDDLNPTAASI